MMDEEYNAAPELTSALQGNRLTDALRGRMADILERRSTFAPADRITEMLRPRDPFVTAGMAALQSYGSGQSFGDVYGRAQAQDTQRAEAVRRLLMGERQMAQQDTANQLAMARLVQQQTEAAAQQGNRQATLLRETVNSLTDDPQERAQLYTYAGQNRDKLDEGNLQTVLGQYAAQSNMRGKVRGGDGTEFERLIADLPKEEQDRLRRGRAESLSRGSGPLVQVGDTEKEYDKARGKQFAQRAGEITDAATRSRSMLTNLSRLETALNDPNVYTGPGGDTVNRLKAAASVLGLNVEGVANAELARSIGNQLALQLRNTGEGAGMPGALSDKDREFLVASVPGLGNTPAGNRLMIDFMRRVAQRNLEIERAALEYERKNGRIDNGFYAEVATKFGGSDLFTDNDRKRVTEATPQTTASPLPSIVPRPIGRTRDGRAVYQAPDGTKYTLD